MKKVLLLAMLVACAACDACADKPPLTAPDPVPYVDTNAAKAADDEARKGGGAPAADPAPVAVGLSGFDGQWMEYWGEGQETDVAYHDNYRIDVSGDQVTVRCVGKDQTIDEVSVTSDGELRFTLHTSFAVQYALRVSPDGDLRGSATTPNRTFNIRWARSGG